MQMLNKTKTHPAPMRSNPYEVAAEGVGRGAVSTGMSAAELVAWLIAMAALALGMLWLLWHVSR